jgi:hypothetical protein
MEFHLGDAKLFAHCSHHLSERSLHARTRLNLFSTFGHPDKHLDPLSAVGQRAVTDNPRKSQLEGRL